jgi:hypothetical protein
MNAQCWAVTWPKASAPRASGPSHITGLKGRVGSVMGPSLAAKSGRAGLMRPLVVAAPGAHAVAWPPAMSGATRWSSAVGRASMRVRLPARQGEGSKGSPMGSDNGGAETWAARRSSLDGGMLRWSTMAMGSTYNLGRRRER